MTETEKKSSRAKLIKTQHFQNSILGTAILKNPNNLYT